LPVSHLLCCILLLTFLNIQTSGVVKTLPVTQPNGDVLESTLRAGPAAYVQYILHQFDFT
jgi:hypothetical protein